MKPQITFAVRDAFVVAAARHTYSGGKHVVTMGYAARVLRLAGSPLGFRCLCRQPEDTDAELVFATFAEAERVVADYNSDPGAEDGITSARWNDLTLSWDCEYEARGSRDSDAENFYTP